MVAKSKPNEIRIIRVYDASVEEVWDAWTDLDKVSQWWGPRGFTITTHSKELKPGGIWHYTMHGPDGVDYPNKTLYHEVEEYRRLVYDHGGYDDRPPLFRMTVLFHETDGQTTIDITMALATEEAAKSTRKFIKDVGGNATWDRLAEFLDEVQQKRTSFVINRSFELPVDQLFKLWSEPAELARWMPPKGFVMKLIRGNIRQGESIFFQMCNSEGISFFARFDYKEVQPNRKIVYIQQFCHEDGSAARHPGLPEFPSAMLTTIHFAAEEARDSRVTVVSELLDASTNSETNAFKSERTGMTLGWSGSFNQLDELIAG